MRTLLKNLRAVAHFRAARFRTNSAAPPSATRLTVIAPHPDDETLGCGGAVALAARSGAKVRIIMLSDGEASLRAWDVPKGTVAEARRRQAVRASAALGVAEDGLRFLSLPDGALPVEGSSGFSEAVQRLADLLTNDAPDTVLCPHPADGWPDHGAAAAMSRAACALLNPKPVLRYYAVWLWFAAPWGMPGLDCGRASVTDVRTVLPAKLAAVDAYLRDAPSPAGVPWCGRLPWSLRHVARQPAEITFHA